MEKAKIFNGHFFEPLLFELKATRSGRERKKLLYNSLNIMLCDYLHNYSVADSVKEKGKYAYYCLSSNLTDIELDKHLSLMMQNMIHMVLFHEGDREELLRNVVFKLLCMIIALNTSDKDANSKFRELAKELSINWHKALPDWVAIRCLKSIEKDFPTELELLEKYSF